MKPRTYASAILIAALACFALAGCSAQVEQSTDEAFISDMQSGLEARWDLNAIDDQSEEETSKDTWEGFIDAEYEYVGDYADAEFEDEELGKLAAKYINLLDEAYDALDYYKNYEKFYAENSKIYKERCAIIYELSENYGLITSEDYDDTFSSMVDEGKTYLAIQDIMENATFKLDKSEEDEWSSYHTYKATVENTSDVEFSYFAFNINLNDKNGVTVDNESAYAENWAPGTKHKFEFGTDESFKDIEIATVDYDY